MKVAGGSKTLLCVLLWVSVLGSVVFLVLGVGRLVGAINFSLFVASIGFLGCFGAAMSIEVELSSPTSTDGKKGVRGD